MRAELKTKSFFRTQDLTDFVNEHGITRENIQAIICHGCLMLFYWEVTI